MVMSAVRIELSEDVAFRELSGQAVLLDLASGIYFGLNEVGTRLWELLSENDSLDSATDALEREFDVSADVLRADVNQLLEQMQSKGLLQIIRS
jgi:hypothetical protein